MEAVAAWKECYHFRLLYRKPYFHPIYGALRFAYYENEWELYKRNRFARGGKVRVARDVRERTEPGRDDEKNLGIASHARSSHLCVYITSRHVTSRHVTRAFHRRRRYSSPSKTSRKQLSQPSHRARREMNGADDDDDDDDDVHRLNALLREWREPLIARVAAIGDPGRNQSRGDGRLARTRA